MDFNLEISRRATFKHDGRKMVRTSNATVSRNFQYYVDTSFLILLYKSIKILVYNLKYSAISISSNLTHGKQVKLLLRMVSFVFRALNFMKLNILILSHEK